MKRIISTLALVATLAAWAAREVPGAWKSQYRPPAESAFGWATWDIYQSQAWQKGLNPRANVSHLLPEPEITARVRWHEYTPYESGNAVFIFHRQPETETDGEVRYVVPARNSQYQRLTFKAPSNGRLRGGLHMVETFLDLDGNGAWTAGEPYGVATDVDVGWHSASFDVELTDTSPQMFRINLRDAAQSNDFESQRVHNDRGVKFGGLDNGILSGGRHESNVGLSPEFVGTNMPQSYVKEARIRVCRISMNGIAATGTASAPKSAFGVALDCERNIAVNQVISERDVLAEGKLDLDWDRISSEAEYMSIAFSAITSTTYYVVLGDGEVKTIGSNHSSRTNNPIATAFVNVFELGGVGNQTKCVPIAPKGAVYSSRPTFKWTHPNTIGKDYPAFRLRVWNGATVMYDSGELRAPPRDADGVYSWTAPICSGNTMPNGKRLTSASNYTWSVSMLDAKFTSANSTETKANFNMNPAGIYQAVDGYGMISTTLEIPDGIDVSGGQIRFQAFTSPDFAGDPVAEVSYPSTSAASPGSVSRNLGGLPMGIYFIRAFVDSDNDGVLDDNESCGYSENSDGTLRPRQIVVRSESITSALLSL